jgi:hypothetical protein
MVPPPRAPLRADRLRALNVPVPVRVQLDARGLPAVVRRKADGKRVETVGEIWRVDDEWWRAPLVRRYYEVVLEGGARVVLFEDLVTGAWWLQRPA